MSRLELLTAQQAALLREMDHRIAHSLALITARLGLHAHRRDDETVQEALLQAGERVEAVARRLHTAAAGGRVAFRGHGAVRVGGRRTIIVDMATRALHAGVRRDLGRQDTRVAIDTPT